MEAVGSGSAASAATVSPDTNCCTVTELLTSGGTAYHIGFPGGGPFRDGPGPGTMEESISSGKEVNATLGSSASVSLSSVIASAQVSVSASLEASATTTVTSTFSKAIPSGKYLNAQFVSYGYKVPWKEVRVASSCAETTLYSGTATIPSNSIGWYNWTTTS
ncbi:hypothetical protein [Gryllotalpicola sp.]|uniref:hypothetical protein n=1 Tax=Gryllotalpicola sp. TaxID=1932787 RepID=UPI00260E759E|nr:hypothetical protein [Gryllotalpicola sp.]